MNNKVLSNLDMDPSEALKLAETESTVWTEAQILNLHRTTPHVAAVTLLSILGRWCFADSSWKENDFFFLAKIGIVF